MQVELIEKNALFLFDDEGIIVITDIKKNEDVLKGELIYDGKNVVILNRNDKEFFSFKNIAPFFRDKIKQSKYVTIVEEDGEDMYSYKVEVHIVDDFGFKDDFDVFAQKVIDELKEKMSPQEFEEFMNESQKFVQEIE